MATVNDKLTKKSATVLQFPRRGKDLGVVCGGVWTCGCGGQDWVLYGNGVCLCRDCNCISTVLKVVQDPTPIPPEKLDPARVVPPLQEQADCLHAATELGRCEDCGKDLSAPEPEPHA
jgi:hypothetical protein